jgi:hypothetical protein
MQLKRSNLIEEKISDEKRERDRENKETLSNANRQFPA